MADIEETHGGEAGDASATKEAAVKETIDAGVDLVHEAKTKHDEKIEKADSKTNDGTSTRPVTQTEEQEEVEPEMIIDPAVIDKLTTGTLGLFLPNLQKAKGSLNEVLHNQEVLIETIQQENAKFTDSVAITQLKQTMDQAKIYHSKLVGLKREMAYLMDKSTKLKRRAVKLQQQKQKDELTKAVQLERENERERMLTAKVARKQDQAPS